MVCGRGPSIGREIKKGAGKLGKEIKKGVDKVGGAKTLLGIPPNINTSTPGMPALTGIAGELLAPDVPEVGETSISTQQGFTEQDKRQLRRRQGFQSTRLTRGLLTGDPNISRPSLLGSTA